MTREGAHRSDILCFRASSAEAHLIRALAAQRSTNVSDLLRALALAEVGRAIAELTRPA